MKSSASSTKTTITCHTHLRRLQAPCGIVKQKKRWDKPGMIPKARLGEKIRGTDERGPHTRDVEARKKD